MLRKRLLVVGIVLGMFAFVGGAGCKNVCQKAADHMLDCMKSFCDDNEGNAFCENLSEIEEEASGGVECGDGDKEDAQGMLDKSCEDIQEMLGLVAPSDDGGDEEEEEE